MFSRLSSSFVAAVYLLSAKMTDLKFFCFLLVGLFSVQILAMPVTENGVILTPTVQPLIMPGTVCNDVDEIVSNDPCKPLCACKDGKIFCADIVCSTDSLPIESCLKLPLNGKCCPSYLCATGNSTGDVHYPLPVLMVPPELNLSSLPPSKSELLHRNRKP